MKATLNYLKITPRKVRAILDQVKGSNVEDALVDLSYSPKRAAVSVRKLIKSAADNARITYEEIENKDLIIKTLYANEGPVFRRYRPRAYGRAAAIKRKTSRVFVELEKSKTAKVKKSTAKQKTAIKTVSDDQDSKGRDDQPKSKKSKKDDINKGNKGQGNFVKKIFRRKAI